jgi:peptidoglycan pentaglycine glycine transferase (the first glycine)
MEIREIQDKNEWEGFILSFAMSQFLHSWQWGEYERSLGKRIWRLGVFNQNKLVGALVLIKNILPAGKSYLYSPRFPIMTEAIPAEIFIQKIKEIGQQEKSIFWRVDLFNIDIFKDIKFKKIKDLQPSKTLLLDLTKPDEIILAAMHPKTRYNIRLAEKKGVAIRQGKGEEDIKTFIKLTEETSERDHFKAHVGGHYKKLLNLDENLVKLYLAEYQGQVLAANLMIYFGDTCTYLHGASSNENKNIMAPHLLHWYCISEAKKIGYRYYDFWGADEKKWPGVTRFKKSFVNEKTGQEISYPGTFDFILDKKWYLLYSIAKNFI